MPASEFAAMLRRHVGRQACKVNPEMAPAIGIKRVRPDGTGKGSSEFVTIGPADVIEIVWRERAEKTTVEWPKPERDKRPAGTPAIGGDR